MSYFIVVNPASQSGKTRKRWPKILDLSRSVLKDIYYHLTDAPGDATRITRDAIKGGYRHIISVGGDGTHNEVINGFFDTQHQALNPDVTFSFIPLGTGSDWGRSLGLPKSIEANLHRIKHGTFTKKIDLAKSTFTTEKGGKKTRYYMNIASFGLSGNVSHMVNTRKINVGGTLPYLFSAVWVGARYKNPFVEVTLDGNPFYSDKLKFMVAANARYFGGGMYIAPLADTADGHLDFILVGDLSYFETLKLSPKIYTGSHLQHPKVKHGFGKHMKATSKEEVWFELDGECVGKLPVEIIIVPKAIRIRA